MRQGQQNRRGRGRTSRKPQNPLGRSYESNGPDVKIRGTAAHIAEKYTSLARDALASGDLIAGESYLQHAEHYNRIIMAAQTQFGPPGSQPSEGANGGGFRPHWNIDGDQLDDGGPESEAGDGGGDEFRGSYGRESHGREQQGRESHGREQHGGRESQGGGGQDRERHTGDREHHGSGRDQQGRRGPNGAQPAHRDSDGPDQADAQQPDESTSDPVT